MTRPTALVTGFQPYGGRALNPSAEVVRRLDGARIGAVAVVGHAFPVSYRSLRRDVERVLAEYEPIVVIGLGLWPGTPMIRIERVAVNIADFEIPDNDGELLTDRLLAANGTTARLSTLPFRNIESALLGAGIPARISNTAGTFLCNAALYAFLDTLEASRNSAPCGFIHLPYMPEQVAGLMPKCRISEQGSDRGKPRVAGAHAVFSVLLQMVEEGADQGRIEIVDSELARLLAVSLRREAPQPR